MRLVFLGTGGGGNPPIGVDARAANLAARTSNALVIQPNYPDPPTLLVDAGQEIRLQWAAWKGAPLQPDAVLLSHGHQDHYLGMGLFRRCATPVPVYGTAPTLNQLAQFGATVYANDPTMNLVPHELPECGEATVCGIEVETVPLHHNDPLTGFIVRHEGVVFAHLGDTGPHIEPDVRAAITSCDVLAVNAPFLHNEPPGDDPMAYAYPHHISITAAIALAQEVGAKRLVLLHFLHTTPERELAAVAARHPWVIVPHDGQTLDV